MCGRWERGLMSRIVVVATVVSHSGQEARLREALVSLVAAVRNEPGCIQYDLHEALDDPGQFVFYEIWESEELLERHNNTATLKAFGARAAAWIESSCVGGYRLIA